MKLNMNIAVLIALVFITKISAEEDHQTVPNPKIQSKSVSDERTARSAEEIQFLIQLGRDPANPANVQSASQTGNQLKKRTAPISEENSDTQNLDSSATKPPVDIFEVIPVVDAAGNTYLLSPDDFTQLRQQSIIFPLEEDDEIIASDGTGELISQIQNGDDNLDVTAAVAAPQHMYIRRRGGRPGVHRPLRRRPIRRRGAIQRPIRRRSPLQSPDGISRPNRRVVQRRRRLQAQRRRQLQALNLRQSGRPARRPANKRCANKRLRRRRLNQKLT